MADNAPITSTRRTETSGVEIPQSPRFAIQRRTEAGRWETLTFGSYGDEEPEDSPYHNLPLLYHSRYVAEHIAKAYPNETVRVHEFGAIDEARAA